MGSKKSNRGPTLKCRRHGDLTPENSYIETSNGKERIRCKECRGISAAILRANNPEKMKRYDFGICKKHGILSKETCKTITENGKRRNRCKLCIHEYWAKLKALKNKICKVHGEITAENIISKGRCKLCMKEAYIHVDKVKKNETSRRNYHKNIEKEHERSREKYYRNIEKTRERLQVQGKNITRDKYYEMIEKQNNLCAICNREERRLGRNGIEARRLCIDHCHKSLKIRGLLCTSCNTAIGLFEDNVTILESAIVYLRKHSDHDECAND